MTEFTNQQDVIAAARQSLEDAHLSLRRARNRLQARQAMLDELLRSKGADDPEVLVHRAAIKNIRSEISSELANVEAATTALTDARTSNPLFRRPSSAIEEMDDSIPILLLPVRVETRFMASNGRTELWVRIFPDDVAISHHDPFLTQDEFESGKTYWREVWQALQLADEDEKSTRRRGAWRALAGESSGPRALWIARQAEPAALTVTNERDLVFPPLDESQLATESWNRPPRSNVMPDQFVVIAETGGRTSTTIGEHIPDPLFAGPDPLSDVEELVQSGADLISGPNLEWIYDFGAAVKLGLAVKVPLTNAQAASGIDRLFVLGLRLSANKDRAKELVEELISDHQFAPDGMAILAQGTPTNNTGPERSGFSTLDGGADSSFAIHIGENLKGVSDDPNPEDRSDAQRLVQALGISPEAANGLDNANQFDVRDAQRINKALWSATGGYYLEELLSIKATTVRRVRRFFTSYVTGRGPLPAMRVGNQPYGILPATSMARWKFNADVDDPDDPPMLDAIFKVTRGIESNWSALMPNVARIDRTGDGLADLLETLGLHATSIEFYRRHAVGRLYRWNYLNFAFDADVVTGVDNFFLTEAQRLQNQLGFQFNAGAKIFDLTFFEGQDIIADPLVDDVREADDERLLENHHLQPFYKLDEHESLTNYIGWLLHADITNMKQQRFLDADGQNLPVPKALLFRLLRRALLLTYHDAAMQTYENNRVATASTRLETELVNVESERTVTRWEFIEARILDVLPRVSNEDTSVIDFLLSPAGFERPETATLQDVRSCLTSLTSKSTATLERLLAEHLDLFSYRLDAWQTAFITQRLEGLRRPGPANPSASDGLYLGAFGYLEDIRPNGAKILATKNEIPEALIDPSGQDIFKQPGNDGFIAAPSIPHAATAAVLRNAYLSHSDDEDTDAMAVDLSSARIRAALSLIDGVRNGQDLGALLGYQFERGLHDRYNDPSLNQFILSFRNAFPMLADKITQNEDGTQIESKEARNVFDGYALVEKAFLAEEPVAYPYSVEGLPPDDHLPVGTNVTSAVVAIKSEVERMRQSFDALSDLALAEGVFQMVQGNQDRGGAMLQALTRGENPPEPEFVRSPRGGTALTQRLVVHLDPAGSVQAWASPTTPRAVLEPSVNQWAGALLGPPEQIRFIVSSELSDGARTSMSVADLDLQPIDLVYLASDVLVRSSTTDRAHDAGLLERLIDHAYRKAHPLDSTRLTVSFIEREPDWSTDDISLFEIGPLLTELRNVISDARPLSAEDLEMSSESSGRADSDAPQFDASEARQRVDAVLERLADDLVGLSDAISSASQPDTGEAEMTALAAAMRALVGFALLDAVPVDNGELVAQANRLLDSTQTILASTQEHLKTVDDTSLSNNEAIDIYVQVAKKLAGGDFSFLPVFECINKDELNAAASYRDLPSADSLTRFSFSRSRLFMDEWMQGLTRVRQQVASLEQILTMRDVFGGTSIDLKPLQLPYRPEDHWIALEYPETNPDDADNPNEFRPEGDYLSVVQALPFGPFNPLAPQKGIVVDEWVEVIPNKSETAGIAAHFDQPSTEPPQVVLLAVSPEIDGSWKWNDLVEIVRETIDRAKLRAVEPDQIADTPYGHVLPAILTSVTTNPTATISTDLVYQSEMAFDPGEGNN